MNGLHLEVLDGDFALWRLDAGEPLPEVDTGPAFLSVTRTEDELSVVSRAENIPSGATTELGWRCLKVRGPLPFDMTGVLAALSAPLAGAGIPIFVVSTYDTDYLLVKSTDLDRTCKTLRNEGHAIDGEV